MAGVGGGGGGGCWPVVEEQMGEGVKLTFGSGPDGGVRGGGSETDLW